MKYTVKTISIIGDGSWGTTLGIHLAKLKRNVLIWGAFPDYVAATKKLRENKKFLPGFKIPPSIRMTSDIHEAIAFGDLIVLAAPSEYLESTLERVRITDYKDKLFLSVVKGIQPKTHLRMSEIIYHVLGQVPLAVLAGPTIAKETASGQITTAVIASSDQKLAQTIQRVFASPAFRIYTNTDVVGAEIGGSVKNVIAIACGVCDGLGLGTNAKSAILTRGLAEMTRLGIALGGRSETFYGLSGLGDLATTCFSPNSRNRSVGEALGQGKKIKTIIGAMHMVAEGVITAQGVYELSRKKKIPMPIVEQVYKIVFESKNARQAMADLMNRQVKAE